MEGNSMIILIPSWPRQGQLSLVGVYSTFILLLEGQPWGQPFQIPLIVLSNTPYPTNAVKTAVLGIQRCYCFRLPTYHSQA